MDKDLQQSRGLWMLLTMQKTENNWVMRTFGFGNSCMFSFQWTDRTNECMDGWAKKKEEQLCSLAGACKIRTSSTETGWGSYLCTLFFICFNVWFFTKEKTKNNKKWLGTVSRDTLWAELGIPPLVLQLENVFSFHPADAEWASWTHLSTVGQGFLRGVCSHKHNLERRESQREFGRVLDRDLSSSGFRIGALISP